jgi:hypothetical protein
MLKFLASRSTSADRSEEEEQRVQPRVASVAAYSLPFAPEQTGTAA